MGLYTVIIEASGPHHSAGAPGTDANQSVANLIDTLKANGSTVSSCIFRYGGAHAFSDEQIGSDTATYRAQISAESGTTPTAPVDGANPTTSEAISVDGGEAGATS